MSTAMRLGATVAALLAAACGEPQVVETACLSDAQCGEGSGCIGGKCVARGTGTNLWALELNPSSGSGLAPTEIPSVRFDAVPQELRVEEQVQLKASFDAPSFELVRGGGAAVQVVFLAPSSIAGQPMLSMKAEMTSAYVGDLVNELNANAPVSAATKQLTIQVIPSSPTDRAIPPFSLEPDVHGLAVISLPKQGDPGLIPIVGRLISATGSPPSVPYSARLWAGNTATGALRSSSPLSTVGETNGSGDFQVWADRRFVEAGGASGLVLELAPYGEGTFGPRITTERFAASELDVAGKRFDLQLAPFMNPIRLTLRVVGADSASGRTEGVAGALVRFRAELPGARGGTAVFVAETQTLGDGTATLDLVPGNLTQPLSYEVTVMPPIDAPYRTTCVREYVVTGTNTGHGANLELEPRVRLSGVVRNAEGETVAGVSLRATRTLAGRDFACGSDLRVPSVSTLTDDQGAYELLLDPGTYQLNIEPPTGSAEPYLTLEDYGLIQDTFHPIVLPRSALVEADLRDSSGQPAPGVSVQVYRLVCGDAPPPCIDQSPRAVLSGQARSDQDGRLRMVLPRK